LDLRTREQKRRRRILQEQRERCNEIDKMMDFEDKPEVELKGTFKSLQDKGIHIKDYHEEKGK
jgi:hypothetical protein